MKRKRNYRYIVSMLIVTIGVLSLVIGSSYAILKGNTSSSNEQIVKTGNIEVKLTESFDNINSKVLLMEDKEGLLQESTYDFNV